MAQHPAIVPKMGLRCTAWGYVLDGGQLPVVPAPQQGQGQQQGQQQGQRQGQGRQGQQGQQQGQGQQGQGQAQSQQGQGQGQQRQGIGGPAVGLQPGHEGGPLLRHRRATQLAQHLQKGLRAHATKAVGSPDRKPLTLTAKRRGKMVGGLAADSLGARQVGGLMFAIARRHVARSVLVPDDAIAAAQRALWDRFRLIAEPGGATALSAL